MQRLWRLASETLGVEHRQFAFTKIPCYKCYTACYALVDEIASRLILFSTGLPGALRLRFLMLSHAFAQTPFCSFWSLRFGQKRASCFTNCL